MDKFEFENLVRESVKEIPDFFLSKLKNVDILIEDYPSASQMQKVERSERRGLLLGLYEGVPLTKRSHYGVGGALPDKISIFRVPIMMYARDPEHIKRLVKSTVIHEIAHHFGIDEDTLKKLGR